MLTAALENQHIEIKQGEGDADVVIVQTALEKSQKDYLTIVIQVFDILMLMIAHALSDKPVLLMKPLIRKVRKKGIFILRFAAAPPKFNRTYPVCTWI